MLQNVRRTIHVLITKRIGTFFGHKGAVYQARLSPDAATAATASADFTAFVLPCKQA